MFLAASKRRKQRAKLLRTVRTAKRTTNRGDLFCRNKSDRTSAKIVCVSLNAFLRSYAFLRAYVLTSLSVRSRLLEQQRSNRRAPRAPANDTSRSIDAAPYRFLIQLLAENAAQFVGSRQKEESIRQGRTSSSIGYNEAVRASVGQERFYLGP